MCALHIVCGGKISLVDEILSKLKNFQFLLIKLCSTDYLKMLKVMKECVQVRCCRSLIQVYFTIIITTRCLLYE